MNKISFDNLPFFVNQIYKEIMDLKSIIQEKNRPTIEHSQYLDIEGAIRLLDEHGFKISQSSLYKHTSARKIPHAKFNNKLVFTTRELLTWAENQLNKKENGK